MKTSRHQTVEKLDGRLHQQLRDVANLRTMLDVQARRIAHMSDPFAGRATDWIAYELTGVKKTIR